MGETDGRSAAPPNMLRRAIFILLGIGIVGSLIVFGVLTWLRSRHYEVTDDAAIDGHIAEISPQIAGRVTRLAVDDNQSVAAGQLLIEIDPANADIQRAKAVAQQAQGQAALQQAGAQLALQQAQIDQAIAQQQETMADLGEAKLDLARFAKIDPGAITRQQLDSARATANASAAKLEAARQAVVAARAVLSAQTAAISSAQATLQGDEVAVRDADLQLSYTRIVAPLAGRVTRRTVEPGNYVTPGQALLDIVPSTVWVTANFRETQLAHMQPGQSAELAVDAMPGHRLRGHVDSFQAGTGAVFSTLPAENATGNYVKVLQRVPVKIVLDDPPEPGLGLGMSVTATVKVR